MRAFTLNKSYIVEQGEGRSPVSFVLDGFLSGIDEEKQAQKARRKTKHRHSIIQPIGPIAGRGWHEKKFNIKIDVDGCPIPIPTHRIDNFKQLPGQPRGVGVEVEWNNKDPFYDRDLNNSSGSFDNSMFLWVGVIITRLSELQDILDTVREGAVVWCRHDALGQIDTQGRGWRCRRLPAPPHRARESLLRREFVRPLGPVYGG